MKKYLSIILAVVLCLSLFAGCGNDQTATPTEGNTPAPSQGGNENPLAGTHEIKVWVAENHVALTEQLITKFNETNEYDIVIKATIEPVGEGDAATQMINDVEKGADLFTFAQDQTARLIQAGALAELGKSAQELVAGANAAGVVSAATAGDTMYAYPMTADNGYFMYYDKSVIKEESIDSLEALIADCEAAGRYFSFQLEGSGWYTASFFFGAGCVSSWGTNAEGKYDTVNDDFNSDKGIIAAKGMQILLQSKAYNNSSECTEFAAAIPSAVVISGTWNYDKAVEILGDNMGVAKLPTYTVDGTTYQLGSFNGCKLLGVKPQQDSIKAAVVHLLAQYLTNEESQLARFEALSWGPANLNAQANEAVMANPGLAALLAQSPYSVPQGQVPGDWWATAQTLATNIKEAAAGDEEAIKTALTNYEAAIKLMADPSTQLDPESWGVVGAAPFDWSKDASMTKQEDGTWKSNEAYELTAGSELKCRKGGQWDEQVGAGTGDPSNDDNYVVAESGKYYIVLNVEERLITLVPAE